MQDPIEEDNRLPVGNAGNFVADLTDDDATILDSLVSSEAEPPDADELPIVRLNLRPLAAKPIPAITRMLTRNVWVPPNTAFLLLTDNPWRTNLRIESSAPIAAQPSFFVAPSRTQVLSRSTAFGWHYAAYDNFELSGYNGELWLFNDMDEVAEIFVMELISQEAGR